MQLDAIQKELQTSIKPNLTQIQTQGFYPKDSLVKMGEYGLYANFLQKGDKGLMDSILGIAEVSKVCTNTGFCVWCQNVLAWYLSKTTNQTLQKELFESVSYAKVLGGTGLSNPIKSYAGMENFFLKSKRVSDGFIINGTLPWVSNIQTNHIFGAVATIDSKDYNLAGIIRCYADNPNVKLKDNISFIALDGSATKSIVLTDYFLSDNDILGVPAEGFLLQVTGGFLLLQIGMALGCIDLSLDLIQKSNIKKSHINAYLPISQTYLEEQRNKAYEKLHNLVAHFEIGNKEYLKAVLELRLEFGNLTLEATQSAMLHAGSLGYLANSPQSKLLLESLFVALVSPSIRHLYKELDSIKNGGGTAKQWQETLQRFQESKS